MKIHEYQGKEILRQFGVPVPRGIPAFTVQEAVEAAQKLGGPVWVVKAQIHAGGRGKGGGVKVAKSIDDVKKLAEQILGMQLVTHQTGPEGQKVRRLYIEDGADIQKEYYLSAVTDRGTQKVAFIASSEGGMDIEEVAHSTPEKIITVLVDPIAGFTQANGEELAKGIGMPADSVAQFIDICQKLYKCYMDTDASLVEINPLNRDSKGNVIALDSKFNFDPNALFRHPELVALRDLDEEDPAEVEASKFDLAYISLDGNIGCLVNGAGLAMATMDTIKLFGGEPANFLDVGGGATPEKVTEAFKIMLKNPKVKGILVNIIGGIMKCETIATGVITACKAVNLSVPLVVRMKGTNEELGKKLADAIGVPAGSTAQAVDVLQKLYKIYMDTDASLVEINPLILEGNGNIKALDAKFNFDPNALFRHPEIVALRDLDEEDPAEIEASKFDLAYISLDGNIGCLVNGAGLAMATMDTIKLYGAEPANFLDVGGGATPEKVTEAFKIMLKNPKVEAIMVNIFGGIMKCDTIATGVITACKAVNLSVPLVVRMKGTNEDLGKKMLAESGLPIISADTMAEAAEKVVAAVKAAA